MKLGAAPTLDCILESAVIASWPDLKRGAKPGSLHLEYAFGADNSLDCLKLWSSTFWGHSHLICEYWMSPSPSHSKGIHFENGFRSECLTQSLDSIMQHQQTFLSSPNFGRTGLLQIPIPTEEESSAAAMSVREAFAVSTPSGKSGSCLSGANSHRASL
jgi:hypothetical protein